ncbi:TRAF-interacting protein with FHA domain-containing protein B isoform X3 [Eptesicus fuscus]|uniref:TRAF-interacting protein with FHA domain-containing protein B isoform X3 n=1 Tax=Eptesicus fuscus TaxID=29078 RepID=UPI002403DFC0|nr:TRAF-interacting protein with FHA domain-containing protein B isoform X3 [Eptesicus fuscus]
MCPWRLPPMERPLTVLRVSLYHPTQGSAVFATVPQRLQHDTSPLLVGRGLDSHLQLHLPRLSRRHLSLEPYREKGSALLAFSLKALSRRGCVWVNGLALRFLEQVPLSTINRVVFAGIQMVVHVEGGTSLEAFVCCFLVSPSPLIYSPQAEETDEWEDIPKEPPAPGSEQPVPGHLGFLHGPSQTAGSSPQPGTGGGTEIQLQREPADGALC